MPDPSRHGCVHALCARPQVDIDGGPEIDLVRRIAEEPELYERVDELFFEYRASPDFTPWGW